MSHANVFCISTNNADFSKVSHQFAECASLKFKRINSTLSIQPWPFTYRFAFSEPAHGALTDTKRALLIMCPKVPKEIPPVANSSESQRWQCQAFQVHLPYNFPAYFFDPVLSNTFTQFWNSVYLIQVPWWPLGYQRVSWCSRL